MMRLAAAKVSRATSVIIKSISQLSSVNMAAALVLVEFEGEGRWAVIEDEWGASAEHYRWRESQLGHERNTTSPD